MQLLGRPHLFALLLQSVQAPSGQPAASKAPCISAQPYYKLTCFRTSPIGWTVDEGAAQDRLWTQEPNGGTILHAYLSSGTRHAETVRKLDPSPINSVFTGNGVRTKRLLRIRRRNIRFLCSSRKNRMRGLLPPAKETIETAMGKHDCAEEALALRAMRLKDPLVDEVPVRRWRTHWYGLTSFPCI